MSANIDETTTICQSLVASVLLYAQYYNMVPRPAMYGRRGSSDIIQFELFTATDFPRYFLYDNYLQFTLVATALVTEAEWGQFRARIAGGCSCTWEEAFALLLCRLRTGDSPYKLVLLTDLKWDDTKVVKAYNGALCLLASKFRRKVMMDTSLMCDVDLLTRGALAVARAGLHTTLSAFVAFIDGTHVPIARPSGANERQRVVYDGHHKV